jgi:hypothetical protein
MVRMLLVVLFAGACSGGVWAQSEGGSLDPAPFSTKIWDDFSLQNVASKGHKALGYATVTLGTAAILVQTINGGNVGVAHQILGESAAIAAGTTVVAGLVSHWDKLSWSGELLTWHNLHAATATVGALTLCSAAFVGGSDVHSKLGIAGTLLMALAIVFEG